MCGIAGLLNLDGEPAAAVLVQRMSDMLAHRGPDGDGVLTCGPCGLGHRRLAIIDLTAGGRQPMTTADGRFTITYNGELYNFQELRAELQAAGQRFVSRSDTEVVLKAIAEWGMEALSRFNGMFAFAVWDAERRELLLARDRFGVKPLYWARTGATILFGSEVKALLTHPRFSAEMDPAGLAEYLSFQNFFTDRTLFRNVRLLPAGCILRIGLDDGEARLNRYWDYAFTEPETPETSDAYVEELDRLFCQAVGRQLVSDVPVSSYLSGGIDSGSVTAVASRYQPEMQTFTVGFDLHSASGLELGMDERELAEHMSYLFGTEHYEMVLKAGDMERILPRMTWHLEEPRVGQSYPNFYAAQLASKFGKVVLAGTGGDELFGGYPWRYYRAVINQNFEAYVDKYHQYWQRLVPASLMPSLLRPIWSDVRDLSTRDIFRNVFDSHAADLTRPEDYINHSLYLEAKTFLHGLLVVDDKLSMAHGLETRVPFLDNDLVDFAMRTPVGLKLGNLGEVIRLNENQPGPKTQQYFDKTHDGKLILRKAMRRHVPDRVSEGQKKGFSAPDATWFRGESIEYVRRMLLHSRARIYEFIDRETVQALVADHLDGRVNRRLLIWSLLSLEQWCRTFLDGGAVTATRDVARIL
ncbi:asparagine synthase (glutamine-hydrolyzing) [Azospirillum agricola]|uniref:asparagine synthase (glutamine-hydrolyzing) n=1 Tax=Azospirillum agricola TaxID=1720247 RepID=UPI000A0F024F|nr:asparagine synthase (glutamine-hydrolyzing) [Azospirillum agricola]SMH41621.1 asparagine synthase (glutamine-hydrolysing) [Azospirillum lipoferum]